MNFSCEYCNHNECYQIDDIYFDCTKCGAGYDYKDNVMEAIFAPKMTRYFLYRNNKISLPSKAKIITNISVNQLRSLFEKRFS